MKVLSIDYGEKRIGLALGDSESGFVFPSGVIENKSIDFVIEEIKNKCSEETVEKILVGKPVSLSGEMGPQVEKINEFIENLKENLDIPIEVEDERLSSKMADSLLAGNKGASRDEVAAMVILEGYINRPLNKL